MLSPVLGQPPPLEKDLKISYNVNDVNFILWTPEYKLDHPLPFNASAAVAANNLLEHGFNPERPTKILVHGWTSEGLEFSHDF